jgi:peptide/nickel transport system permease protein
MRTPLLAVAVRRLLMAVPLLFVVSALSFVLVSVTPGDAAREILGTDAPPGAYPKLRHVLGLDLPLPDQYWRWLKHALHGDFGTSLFTSESVTQAIDQRLSVTLSLILSALLVSLVVGICLGVYSAVQGGRVGRLVDAFALCGFALPSFWVGAILIAFLSVRLRWFPVIGYVPLTQSPKQWFLSLALPVTTLALPITASIAKQTRESMLDVLGSEYVRMAWANGISPQSILFRHALKNAAMRVVTVLGVQAVGLVGATPLVEDVFGLPGLSRLAVDASSQHDLPMVQGAVLYFTVIVVVINLVIDLAYTGLNPRVRTR